MPKDALTITDQRNGNSYEAPVEQETIRAMDLRKIKTNPDDFGLMTYDPAFMNTASCKSSITYIDGDKGILRYRVTTSPTWLRTVPSCKWPTCCSTASCPIPSRTKDWVNRITHHTMLHETTKDFINGFRYDAHPMANPGQHCSCACHRLSSREGGARR